MPDLTPPAPAATNAPLPARIGAFRVLAELGRGASGVVYLAEQDWPARRVALKLLRNGLASAAGYRRFLTETTALASLSHPGIAHLYQPGTVHFEGREQAFLAMEYVDGVPLHTWIEHDRPGLAARLRCIVDVCRAIGAAHRKGVVHRDLKPDNILVEVHGSRVRPRVLDFGVAKLLASEDNLGNERRELVGTLDYASPEQVEGSPHVDGRTDIYALGVITWQLLTGDLPLAQHARSRTGSGSRRLRDRSRPLAELAPHLAGDLAQVLATALAIAPADRYADADVLADDLEAWLAHRPVSVRQATPTYRFSCFARRQRLLCASIGLCMLSLAGAAAAGWWAYAGSRQDLGHLVATTNYTVDRILGRLNTIAGTSAVRAEALRHLLPQIDECVRLQPDDVPTLQCKERIVRFLGDLAVEAARWDEARQLRGQAEAVSHRLVELRPDDPLLQADWATAIVRVGDVAANTKDITAGLDCYHRAHRIYEALATSHPEEARHVDDLAWSCDRLAYLALVRGDLAAVEQLLQRRRELLDRLAVLRPGSCTNLAGERELHSLLSQLEGARGNHAARRQHEWLALQPAREWVRREPNHAGAAVTFAGSVLAVLRDPEHEVPPAEARVLLAEASDGIARLLAQEPEHAVAQHMRRAIADLAWRLGR